MWRNEMQEKNEFDNKEKILIEAFSDLEFTKEIKSIRLEIEEELVKFVNFLKMNLEPEQKIFENIETRIKGIQSFREKLYRKDYIKDWKVSDDIKENQRLIAQTLPDLIGFRITCFFWQDEEKIYNILKEYYEHNNFQNIELNFNENRKQENGHKINKLSGKYKSQYCFEIQIKSIMHNMWGEVEHKTIYKNRNYDANISSKKAITEEIFNILQASDKQLLCIFKEQYEEKQLLQALFYERTKTFVNEKCKTDILAKHYSSYFNLFSNNEDFEVIKQYIAYSLLKKDFLRKEVSFNNLNPVVYELRDRIQSEFRKFNIKCLFYISEIVLKIDEYDSFLIYLSKYLIEQSGYDLEDGEIFEGEDIFDEDLMEETDDYQESILVLLDQKIGGRKLD